MSGAALDTETRALVLLPIKSIDLIVGRREAYVLQCWQNIVRTVVAILARYLGKMQRYRVNFTTFAALV